MRNIWVNSVFLLAVMYWESAMADTANLEKTAERLFSAETVDKEWFSGQGLASAVPRVVEQLIRELGPLQSIPPCGERCTAVFERGELHFDMKIDSDGLITSILIDPPVVYSASLEDAVQTFSELPGSSSVYVTRDGEVIGDLNGDAPMAVGSAFKLAVLKALNQLIGAGKLEWDQVVELKEEWRSVPSGQLQDWPVGAPLTLHTLASLMISVSDNTATDALIDLVSRGSLETVSPLNRPFLTTREFFQLKRRDSADLRRAFAEGSFDERMGILSGLSENPLPAIGDLNTDPLLQIEWFFSGAELCRLMDRVKHLDVVQINPGIALTNDWERVAYKGGSDFGALNFTTALTAKDGKQYCVSATWNNAEPLDETAFSMLYAGLLYHLK